MSDKVACWSWCVDTTNCDWFSYDTTENQSCNLFEACPKIDDEQYPQFISGHKDCLFTYSMLFR